MLFSSNIILCNITFYFYKHILAAIILNVPLIILFPPKTFKVQKSWGLSVLSLAVFSALGK